MSIGVLINIGIGAIIAIAAIIGLAVGFCRQFSRPLVGIVAIAAAIMLVILLYPIIVNTGILNGFTEKATGWFNAEYYTQSIASVEDLQGAISDNYLRILSGSADRMFARMHSVLDGTGLEMTIGNFFGKAFVNITVELGMWIVLYLIIKYFLFGVKYLLGKITQVVVFKSIDKIFGVIWSLLWTYLIVVSVILTVGETVIVQFVPNVEPMLAQWIQEASLLKLAHNTNVLGSFIANLLGMPLVQIA